MKQKGFSILLWFFFLRQLEIESGLNDLNQLMGDLNLLPIGEGEQ